jgi:hypothetical protein
VAGAAARCRGTALSVVPSGAASPIHHGLDKNRSDRVLADTST